MSLLYVRDFTNHNALLALLSPPKYTLFKGFHSNADLGDYWIGLNDIKTEGRVHWLDDETDTVAAVFNNNNNTLQ